MRWMSTHHILLIVLALFIFIIASVYRPNGTFFTFLLEEDQMGIDKVGMHHLHYTKEAIATAKDLSF